nr:ribonuclease H-like domain-containing protein [Tanacetum cinerariifolium]
MKLESIQTSTTIQDYDIWDVIKNGNSFKLVAQITTNDAGTSTTLIPALVTTEEKTQKKNDVKVRSMLLMALPSEHLMTFNQYKDAKTLFAAIETRLGENEATKKTQTTLLKQLLKELHAQTQVPKTWLLRHLPILTVLMKFLPLMAASTQSNIASTKVSIANLSDSTMYAFLSNQSNGSQLIHEDLEQIHEDDLEEIDLKWQLALLSMGANSYMVEDEVPTHMALMTFSDSEISRNLIDDMLPLGEEQMVVELLLKEIHTSNLDFEDVYFVNELKFNIFSVLQMCDKKNNVLFTDSECLVLSPNFKLPDENQILLRVPRTKNMCSVDMKNIIPKESLTCLIAKATLDESMLWHRRLGHINFKNINKLIKDNLVRVTKNQTSGILKKFITEIENLVDKKFKVIRSDNGTEFKNSVLNHFCSMKGIQREFSVARTPQQNGVAERRNRTLIVVARTMLADSKLPTTFWVEAVNIACYV